MSSTKIICPPETTIQDITIPTCFEDFGQVQKLAFQRQFVSAGVKNTFVTATNSILVQASWDAFIAAADASKIQTTPFVENPTFEPGAAREVGGGNATLGGISKKIGKEVTSADFLFNALPQSTIEELKKYEQEGTTALGVFLFNEHGQIGCIVDDHATPTEYYPIPIALRTLSVGDKKIGGLEEEDSNALMFQFFANWSDKFVVLNPTDFNPLTDLVN